jgi:hypothetical protein
MIATATAPTTSRKIRRTTRTTGSRGTRRTRIATAADGATDSTIARLLEQEEMARAAGLSLPPPVYALGTPVVQLGVDNFRAKRLEWEARPSFGSVCTDAIERIHAEARSNVEVKLSDLYMSRDGKLFQYSTGAADDPSAPRWNVTKCGMWGLMQGLGVNAGGRYLLDAPADLRALNINYWAHAMALAPAARAKAWSLRTRECLEPTQLGQREVFAATSVKYPVLDADTLAEVAAELVPAGARGELLYDGVRFRLGASWFSDICPEDAAAGEVFRAYMFLTTRDDGRGSISVRWGVERNLCLNLIILGKSETKLSLRHAGDVDELRVAVRAAMTEGAAAIGRFATAWTSARHERVLDGVWGSKFDSKALFAAMVDEDMVRVPGVKAPELVERLVHAWEAEPGFTKADLVNAITRAAHTEAWASPWVTESLEEQAGALLENRVYWNRIEETAAGIALT